MTIPQNVKDAVSSIDDSETVAATPHPDWSALVKIISVDDWQIISAHLLSQAAELKILRVKCSGTLANNLCPDHRDKQVGNPCLACTIEKLQSGLAAADALLGKVYAYLDRFDPNSEVYDEVESHLQAAGAGDRDGQQEGEG